MNKLKAITRSVSFSSKNSSATLNKNNRHEKLEPIVGFKLTLYEAANETASGGKVILEFCLTSFIFFFPSYFQFQN